MIFKVDTMRNIRRLHWLLPEITLNFGLQKYIFSLRWTNCLALLKVFFRLKLHLLIGIRLCLVLNTPLLRLSERNRATFLSRCSPFE